MRSLSHTSCDTNGDLLCASYVRRGKKMIDRYSKGFSHATFVFFLLVHQLITLAKDSTHEGILLELIITTETTIYAAKKLRPPFRQLRS